MNALQIINMGLDEDTNIIFEHEPLLTYKWRGYIKTGNDFSMASTVQKFDKNGQQLQEPVPVTLDAEVENQLFTNDNGYFLAEENEFENYQAHVDEFRKVMTENPGGVMVSWAMEYDSQFCYIYGDTKEVIETWLNREPDETEFDGI